MNNPLPPLADHFTPLSSLQNSRVKNVVKLSSRRQRDSQRLTVVEGGREVQQALVAGLVPAEAFICPEIIAETVEGAALVHQLSHLATTGKTAVFTVTPEIFTKIAYRSDSGGVVLVVPYFARRLDQIVLGKRPFVVVVVGGEKPGNIGAILRTADSAGVDALILCQDNDQPGTDIHNPNVVRASLGAVFTIPVAMASSKAARAWLQSRQLRLVATTPQANQLYTAVDLRDPIALILGSEAWGLSSNWLAAADTHVAIPMHGQVDSLNLSVSAALLMYEVIRQRQLQSEPI